MLHARTLRGGNVCATSSSGTSRLTKAARRGSSAAVVRAERSDAVRADGTDRGHADRLTPKTWPPEPIVRSVDAVLLTPIAQHI